MNQLIDLALIIVVIVACMVLLVAAIIEFWRWFREPDSLSPHTRYLMLASLVLLCVVLILQAIARGHIPPIEMDEIGTTLVLLLVALALKVKQAIKSAGNVLSLILSLATVAFVLSHLISRLGVLYQGGEPLWLWALLGRWSVLVGIAGLSWLLVIFALAWGGPRIKNPTLKTRLLIEDHALISLGHQLRPLVFIAFLVGLILSVSRHWWGWGQIANQDVGLMILALLLLASWWLRFTSPHRVLWTLTLTGAAFIMAWPVLITMSA